MILLCNFDVFPLQIKHIKVRHFVINLAENISVQKVYDKSEYSNRER